MSRKQKWAQIVRIAGQFSYIDNRRAGRSDVDRKLGRRGVVQNWPSLRPAPRLDWASILTSSGRSPCQANILSANATGARSRRSAQTTPHEPWRPWNNSNKPRSRKQS